MTLTEIIRNLALVAGISSNSHATEVTPLDLVAYHIAIAAERALSLPTPTPWTPPKTVPKRIIVKEVKLGVYAISDHIFAEFAPMGVVGMYITKGLAELFAENDGFKIYAEAQKVFSTPGNIAISESFYNKDILLHEATHRAFDKLSDEEKKILIRGKDRLAQYLKKRYGKAMKNKPRLRDLLDVSRDDVDEFYAYSTAPAYESLKILLPETIRAIGIIDPEAHKIYLRLKKEAEDSIR